MAEAIVARHGQITLSKELREELGIHEGDTVIVNKEGERIMVAKKDVGAWDGLGDFLPKDFKKTLHAIRRDSTKRFKRLGFLD